MTEPLFEIKTPALVEVMDAYSAAIDGPKTERLPRRKRTPSSVLPTAKPKPLGWSLKTSGGNDAREEGREHES